MIYSINYETLKQKFVKQEIHLLIALALANSIHIKLNKKIASKTNNLRRSSWLGFEKSLHRSRIRLNLEIPKFDILSPRVSGKNDQNQSNETKKDA